MINEMKSLIQKLNYYNDAYYNKNLSIISDYEYDTMFNRLKELENMTGVILTNSPTINVGAEVKSNLEKVEHNHVMLSLDKTKNAKEIEKFIGKHSALSMLKMDGLTITLTYRDGNLVAAETRGNGFVGEDVLHTVKTFKNIPIKINIKDEIIVDGEAIIDLDTFDSINRIAIEKARQEGMDKGLSGEILENYIKDNSYKNARNLAAGSVRQLDSKVASERELRFIAWKFVKGSDSNSFIERLDTLESYGFEVVPYIDLGVMPVQDTIEKLKEIAEEKRYPIDGIVFSYDNVSYGESLGATSHHMRSQMAFKFYDEEQETVLKDVEWSLGRTGVLTPVAIFEPVELEGTTVERASIHNVSMFKKLALGIGDSILVYKANKIIPQISDNLTRSGTLAVPCECPVCHGGTMISCDNDTEVLMCTNPECDGKLTNKIANFVGRNGMDVRGLSKKTIDKLVSIGALNGYMDIYRLKDKVGILRTLEGLGDKSINNLLNSIEDSKTVSLEKFLCALGIPGVGKSKCKELSKQFVTFDKLNEAIKDKYDFSSIIGCANNKKIHAFWEENYTLIDELAGVMKWETPKIASEGSLTGKNIVITGKLAMMKRGDLKAKIEILGGKVSDKVTKNTDFLINNEITSTSSKNKQALSLGIPIVPEKEFIKKYL